MSELLAGRSRSLPGRHSFSDEVERPDARGTRRLVEDLVDGVPV